MKRKSLRKLLIILLLCFLQACFLKKNNSTFSIQFMDVGRGDAALVECDGHYMLIDGGQKGKGDKVYSVLEEKGVQKLDILAISHLHEDHYGGLIRALEYATNIKVTICNSTRPGRTDEGEARFFGELENSLTKNGTSITIPKEGNKYPLGSATVEVIYSRAENDNDSLVLLIKYKDTFFMFTGDTEEETEQELCGTYKDEFPVTLLKVGHHGSDTSTSIRFLRMLTDKKRKKKQYAIISAGNNQSSDRTIEKLEQAGFEIYQTCNDQDILVRSNGKELSVTTNVK